MSCPCCTLKIQEVNNQLALALSEIKNEPHFLGAIDKVQNLFWETTYVFRVPIQGNKHPSYWEVGIDIIAGFIRSVEANEPVDKAYKALVKRLIQEVDSHQDNRKLLVRWPKEYLKSLLEIKRSIFKQEFTSALNQNGIFKMHPVLPQHSNSTTYANVYIILNEKKSTGKSDPHQMNQLAQTLVSQFENRAINENLIEEFLHEYNYHRTPAISSMNPEILINAESMELIKERINDPSTQMLYRIEGLDPELKEALYKALSLLSN